MFKWQINGKLILLLSRMDVHGNTIPCAHKQSYLLHHTVRSEDCTRWYLVPHTISENMSFILLFILDKNDCVLVKKIFHKKPSNHRVRDCNLIVPQTKKNRDSIPHVTITVKIYTKNMYINRVGALRFLWFLNHIIDIWYIIIDI